MGGFSQIMKNILTWQPSGSPAWQAQQNVQQRQQQLDMEQQQQQREQRQSDWEFHQHLTDIGAVPGDAASGLIKQQIPTPATSDPGVPGMPGTGTTAPPSSFSIVRKMDPARTVRFKDADGTPVAYELPTPAEQVQRQVTAAAPKRAAAVQQTSDVSQAQATGAAAGQTAGKIADRVARGTPVSASESQMFNLPQGTLLTPEERAGYHERYFTVQRAGVTAAGAMDRTNAQQTGASDRNAARIQSQHDLLDTKNDFADELNQRKLDYQDSWANARNAIASNTQGSLNNRVLLRQFDSNQQQHGKLLDQTYQEAQKQLEAGALLDPKGGVDDGQDFTDPWSGKKMTMNVAQRLRLGNALKTSQQRVLDLHNRSTQIEQRFGVNATPSGAAATPGGASGAPPASGGGTGLPAGAPAAPGGAPATGGATAAPRAGAAAPGANGAPAGAPRAKVATQAQVQAYAKTKGISTDQALQEFKSAKYAVTGTPPKPLLPVQ